ncbi:Nucleoporin NUP192 [Golovinomyces cichoracearum]|uniref:Nucleoporin NUP192 n=1 Tax=Golovinomyces cichoracearum TaxID=62708 RepID=A0A420I7M5_9PEZI|nr:Nucleoporin NUP192 [Golovinomyces cichoracearum]
MTDLSCLEGLQALHADLMALSEHRLSSIERLGAQLDRYMDDFRNLLDKKARNDSSRKRLVTGQVEIFGNEYKVNEEFQREAQQLADELDLDELEAAQIYYVAQTDKTSLGQPTLTNSLIIFHQRRKLILDCLQMICLLAADPDVEEVLRDDLLAILGQVVMPRAGSQRYTHRCLSCMSDIKSWLQRLADKLNGASVVGHFNSEILDAIEYQRVSLIKQHETIGTILFYLIKEKHSDVSDFHTILEILRKADKYENLLVHYIPALIVCISKYGGTDAAGGLIDAHALHEKLMRQSSDNNQWTLAYVRAAFHVIWLSEYSGWFGESSDEGHFHQIQDDAKQRSKQFVEALNDGAFDFILTVSADIKSAEWYDPARHGLRQWLQRKSPAILTDTVSFSTVFQKVLMEQFEAFIESFIANLPDVLRKLRVDEDEQRQLSKDHDHDLDLERFIVIISYTFEGRPRAAFEGFWDVPDGVLLGFLCWASRRASTPLLSAFCEMLQSISEDEECATAAHQFLLDDYVPASGKMRRTHSITWNQIFKELAYFSGKIRDHPSPLQPQNFRPSAHGNILETEPESVMMLECYLRLITRLCSESEAARTFLIYHPTFSLIELLFQLASSAVGPRLRANAFTTLRSLLTNKTRNVSHLIWTSLDSWIFGTYAPGSMILNSVSSRFIAKESILHGLASGFEEPNAFVQLLHALIQPQIDDPGINNSIPFPETIGSNTRQPGISPYIDFTIDEVFGRPARDLESLDIVQRRLINLNCLEFISTCLETFNENLIIFGSQVSLSIDSAVRVSSLESYVLLHPFTRAMEWIFNQKIMDTLFTTVNQNPAEVACAEPDSPLVLCLLRGIRVMILILELQPTYFEIVRPLLKSHPEYQRLAVSNTSFGCFEDGFLNHLTILPTLGRYCGTGHPELIISSLKLLEKLSSSSKLASASSDTLRGTGRNKALAALDDDSETISKILLREMEADIDINQGPQSPAYTIQLQILDFILSCLRASSNQPSVAHLLLGFRCGEEGLFIEPNSSFDKDVSLFHTILNLVVELPIADETDNISWLVTLHYKALQVLKELWVTPISSCIIIPEMRKHDFFILMFVREQVIQPGMTWDGVDIRDPNFFSSLSPVSLSEFLGRRAILFQYFSIELRQISQIHSPSLKQRILETLMGSTKVEDDQTVDHANLFDFFDFVNFEIDSHIQPPQISWLSDADLSFCLEIQSGPEFSGDLARMEEFLSLKILEFVNTKQLENPQDIALLNYQAGELVDYSAKLNRKKKLIIHRHQLLKAWVHLIMIILEKGDFDHASKTNFVSRALQAIMPKLESDFVTVEESVEPVRLAKALLFSLDFDHDSFEQHHMTELVSDKVFQLFQISLRAINNVGTKVSLKEWHYNICFRYLSGMQHLSKASGLHRRFSINTIKSVGDKFIDLVCDDASNGEPLCRISALFLLICFVKMERDEDIKYIVKTLVRLNFIGLLVESLRNFSQVARNMSGEDSDIDMYLSYCHVKFALLQEISQTRFGATAICNAGLFHAIEDSGLFIIDPDLGVEIRGPDSVEKHYNVMLAMLRIICATILSRGPQNHQTINQGRKFLATNRPSIFNTLKKSAGLSVKNGISSGTIEELTDLYLFLISYTDFIDQSCETTRKVSSIKEFTTFT